MRTIHLIPHTHWDREWYLTFQQFRLKLVYLIDDLINILEKDPNFRYFMLDGQTIVLEDYLQMRPDNKEILKQLVRNGRILIGPWYVLPDEFLVSGEAIIRNLLIGERICQEFGSKMNIGYIPDPFGHISQMPQILKGFSIENVCVQRGLDDQPCEFIWQSPDGSRIFMAYLRDGYGNASQLPTLESEAFVSSVIHIRDSLLPYVNSSHFLLMVGTDHMQPSRELVSNTDYANESFIEDHLFISSLPDYFAQMRSKLLDTPSSYSEINPLLVVNGELRSSKRHHLLPGVLSTRMWIKQRNHACETLMENWVEPFSTFAELFLGEQKLNNATKNASKHITSLAISNKSIDRIAKPASLLRETWKFLLQCHPHDSICGCSIDQVHKEMVSRFDQVEQTGEEIARQSLYELVTAIDTNFPSKNNEVNNHNINDVKTNIYSAIVVFNPVSGPRRDVVQCEIKLPIGIFDCEVIDKEGNSVPFEFISKAPVEAINITYDKKNFLDLFNQIRDGSLEELGITNAIFIRQGNQLKVLVIISSHEKSYNASLSNKFQDLDALLRDPDISTVIIQASITEELTTIAFVADNVPGYGYSTYWVKINERKSHLAHNFINWLIKLGVPVNKVAFQLFLTTKKILSLLKKQLFNLRHIFPRITPPCIISNEYYSVSLSPTDGNLTLIDKLNNMILPGINQFHDGGDCGDEYNYCPPPQDIVVDRCKVRKLSIEKDKIHQAINVSLVLKVPKSISPDRKKRHRKYINLPIISRISLYPGIPRVDFHTEVDQSQGIFDHRLRVHFPTPFITEKLPIKAFYDGHFQVVQYPLGVPDFDQSWVEHPRPERPQKSFTDISIESYGIMVVNKGLPEVEVFTNKYGQAELALTLLRCIGWLSRNDLSNRKGHAGPALATPDAQMTGKWSFDYSLVPHSSTWLTRYNEAKYFNVPLRAVATDAHQGFLPSINSFIQVNPSSFTISAIKPAEDEKGWIIRGGNLLSEPTNVSIQIPTLVHSVSLVNLAEEFIQDLTIDKKSSVFFPVKGYEIVTIKLQ